MPLAENLISGRYSIQAYETDQITINEKIYKRSLILSPQNILENWPVHTVKDLNLQLLQPIFDLKPDVVLLGTGNKQIFPEIEILGAFAQQKLGIEIMDVGALSRTFNILVAEDREVVAAIIIDE